MSLTSDCLSMEDMMRLKSAWFFVCLYLWKGVCVYVCVCVSLYVYKISRSETRLCGAEFYICAHVHSHTQIFCKSWELLIPFLKKTLLWLNKIFVICRCPVLPVLNSKGGGAVDPVYQWCCANVNTRSLIRIKLIHRCNQSKLRLQAQQCRLCVYSINDTVTVNTDVLPVSPCMLINRC